MFIVPEALMATPANPTRTTWRDMMPPDAPEPARLLSRDELIDELRSRGLDVAESELLHWQAQQVIPYAEKERIGKVSYTRYAPWMVDAIQELVRLRTDGMRLLQIRTEMPRIIANVARGDPAHRVDAIGTAHAGRVTITGTTATATDSDNGKSAPAAFAPLADAIARAYEERHGISIRQVDIRLVDDRGNPVSFTFGANT